MIEEPIQINRGALVELGWRYHIRKLSLFGSAVRSNFRPDSDIDILVKFEKGKAPSLGGMVELQEEISTLLGGRKVHLATPAILENPYRRRAILGDLEEQYVA
jgi:uncharacterized protein